MTFKNRTKVDRSLDQLCIDMGFCLVGSQRSQLLNKLPLGIDDFTDALFIAEGLEPQIKTQLRKQVRERVAARFDAEVINDID
jgi:hypothetical protein